MVNEAAHKVVRTREVVLCLAGMAAYWFLLKKSSYQSIFSQDSFYLVFTLVAIIAALAAIALSGNPRPLFSRRLSAASIAMTAAAAIASASAFAAGPLSFNGISWIWLIGAMAFGTSFALLTIWWGMLLLNNGMHSACLLVLASFSLSIALGLVCSLAEQIASASLIASPLISVLSAWALRKTPGCSSASHETRHRTDKLPHGIDESDDDPTSIIGVSMLFLLAGSIVRGLYYSSQGDVPSNNIIQMDALTLLFCMILALVVANSRKDGKKRMFLKAWMILSILFFVGLMLTMAISTNDRKWGDELTLIARLLLGLMLWLVLLNASIGSRRPSVLMSLWVIAETSSSLIAHYIVPLTVSRLPGIADSFAMGTVLPLSLFVLLIAASFFFLQRVIQNLDRSRAAEAEEDPRIARCREIANECGLSSRELEIMMLYSQGLSSRAIAESLYISPNTVRTHVKNIYDKVGVRKKQELIDRVRSKDTLLPDHQKEEASSVSMGRSE